MTRAPTRFAIEAGVERERSRLGVGVSYFQGLHNLVLECTDVLDLVEIEPQSSWFRRDGAFRVDEAEVARLCDLPFAKVLHGIGFPIGGTRAPGDEQIAPLQRMSRSLGTAWISEHLSFNRVRDDVTTGFLLPPRQTAAGALAAARSADAMASALPAPLLVENGVNYLRPREDEMSDGRFAARVVEAADCGILLDLHNAWTNARNGRQPLDSFLDDLPLDRVWEVHLAGGFECGGYWIDSHSGAIPPELVDIAREVVPRLPNVRALVFEIFPSYLPLVGRKLVRQQLELLRELWSHAPCAPASPLAQPVQRIELEGACASSARDAQDWEDALGALVVDRACASAFVTQLSGDPGVAVFQMLLREFRASMVTSVLQLTCRLLLLSVGPAALQELLRRFWALKTPSPYSSDEALAFAAFLLESGPEVPHLIEVAAYERSAVLVALDGIDRVVPFTSDPLMLLRALAEARMPEHIPHGTFEVEITAR